MAPEVINALAYLHCRNQLPLQGDSRSNPALDTIGGLAALALRSRLTGETLHSRPDALLALLWMMEGFSWHAPSLQLPALPA